MRDEMTAALRRMNELAAANHISTGIYIRIDQTFQAYLGVIHTIQSTEALDNFRTQVIATLTPLLQLNAQLPANQQAVLQRMSTLPLPTPSFLANLSSPVNIMDALPPGIDIWFDCKVELVDCKDLRLFARNMKGTLAQDEQVNTKSKEWDELMNSIDRFVNETDPKEKCSDARARKLFLELKKNYFAGKPAMYGVEEREKWYEPSPSPDKNEFNLRPPTKEEIDETKKLNNPFAKSRSTRRSTGKQFAEEEAKRAEDEAKVEKFREDYRKRMHYSHSNTSPSGTARVRRRSSSESPTPSGRQPSAGRQGLFDIPISPFTSPSRPAGASSPAGRGGDVPGPLGRGRGRGFDSPGGGRVESSYPSRGRGAPRGGGRGGAVKDDTDNDDDEGAIMGQGKKKGKGEGRKK